jgi:hypothetical protein
MAEKLDDLYGDLENAVAKQPEPGKPKSLPASSAEENEDVAKLKAENETLKRNMGILYRTAKAELERKDRTIEMLQNELDALKR